MAQPYGLRRALFAALGTTALVLQAGGASAQQAPSSTQTQPAAAAPAPAECSPGVFGEGVDLTPKEGDDPSVTAIHLEFQCGDVLSDGTYIPTGYRIQLEGECGNAACDYPLAFLMPTANDNRFEGSFVDKEGDDVSLRVRKNRKGTLLVVMKRAPGSKEKPTRLRYELGAD